MDTPRVFISYAWTNQDHEYWVISLAERLVSDGVDVIIDKWNLDPGQDKYVFMEKMVQDPTIINVLLVLNEQYKKKSDERSGGVGTEAQIISSELYDKTEQTKFIPIIAERDESGREFAPVFLNNRIYIDLTPTGSYEAEYEKLVRFIYKKPVTSKPQLGTPPAYLVDDRSNPAPLRILEKSCSSSIEHRDRSSVGKMSQYLETLEKNLDEYRLSVVPQTNDELGKVTFEKSQEMVFVRDSYLNIVKTICLFGEKRDLEVALRIFEMTERFDRPLEGRSTWTQGEFDHFALFFWEVAISTIALAIKFERIDLLRLIYTFASIRPSQSGWMVENIESRIQSIFDRLPVIYTIGSYYKASTGKNYYQPLVEIISRRIYGEVSLSLLIEADLVTHYFRLREEPQSQYYPRFAVYLGKCNLDFLSKIIFKDKIEDVLAVFGAKDREEMLTLVQGANFDYDRAYVGDYHRIPKLTTLIKENLWSSR